MDTDLHTPVTPQSLGPTSHGGAAPSLGPAGGALGTHWGHPGCPPEPCPRAQGTGAANMAPPQAAPGRQRGAPQLGWPATRGQLCCPPKHTASHLCALRKRHNRRFITPGTTNTAHFPFHTRIYTHNHTQILPRMTQHSCRSHTPRSGAAERPPARLSPAQLASGPRPHSPDAHLRSARPGSAPFSPARPCPSLHWPRSLPSPPPAEGRVAPAIPIYHSSRHSAATSAPPLLSCRRRGEAPSLAPVMLAEPGVFLRHLNVYARPSIMREWCEGVGCYRNKEAIGSAAE